jgi:HPt (histidine-containing phosphotransfer) domain-containing protein
MRAGLIPLAEIPALRLIMAMIAHSMTGDREPLFANWSGRLPREAQRSDLLAVLARQGSRLAGGSLDQESARLLAAGAEVMIVDTSEVVNKSEILGRLEGDEELLQELIVDFLEGSTELLQQVAAAVASQDAVAVERTAHKLKGTVSIFGCRSASQTALALETMGRGRDLLKAESSLAELTLQMHTLEKALREIRQATHV